MHINRPRPSKPLCIGITGGLASGKSTALRYFAQKGYPVIDADRLARDVVEPGTEGLRSIVAHFGADVLHGDALDRKKLGEIVFRDANALDALNRLLHPRIREAFLSAMERESAGAARMVFSEIPLLFESGYEDFFDVVLTVVAPEGEAIRRAVERDGGSAAQAERIRGQQMPDDEKMRRSDYVVVNNGNVD
ncbi:MAG: dephospho-CoA kinase, partial [Bacillota bacterium]|nr:dephospho-CoA kinase [Bacillota bacterium]